MTIAAEFPHHPSPAARRRTPRLASPPASVPASRTPAVIALPEAAAGGIDYRRHLSAGRRMRSEAALKLLRALAAALWPPRFSLARMGALRPHPFVALRRCGCAGQA